ncbi:MAG: hydroxyacid dehydrogenase [Opitutus sp.]
MRRLDSLLVAISAQERRDFLPDPRFAQLCGQATHWHSLDPTELTRPEFEQRLVAINPEVLVTCWQTPPLPNQLRGNLRYVCHLAGSIRQIVTRSHLANGLIATNWGGSISRIVAEGALSHILTCLRHFTYWTLVMHREGGWKNRATETASLFGRRVGLHGFGQVARELVGLLRPFGCMVTAFAPDVDRAVEEKYGVTAVASLEELFGGNEIIVELAPLIPETTGVVTESLLRLIPAGGVFVNVGRGAVVDEAALLRVATEGKISVGLDVFATEPLPADSGLRGLQNVTLTPHLAGPTTDRRRDAGEFALSNVRAYANGENVLAQITPENYDLRT